MALNFALGALLALSAHRQLMDAHSAIGNRWFRDAVFFAFLIMLPIGVYFYLQWPDWSWLYYVDSAKVGEALTVVVWLAYPLAVMLGFAVTAGLVRGDSPRFALAVPIVGIAALAVVSGIGFERFNYLVSYEIYHGALFKVREGLPKVWGDTAWQLSMAGVGLFSGVALAFLLARNLREGGHGIIPPSKP